MFTGEQAEALSRRDLDAAAKMREREKLFKMTANLKSPSLLTVQRISDKG